MDQRLQGWVNLLWIPLALVFLIIDRVCVRKFGTRAVNKIEFYILSILFLLFIINWIRLQLQKQKSGNQYILKDIKSVSKILALFNRKSLTVSNICQAFAWWIMPSYCRTVWLLKSYTITAFSFLLILSINTSVTVKDSTALCSCLVRLSFVFRLGKLNQNTEKIRPIYRPALGQLQA